MHITSACFYIITSARYLNITTPCEIFVAFARSSALPAQCSHGGHTIEAAGRRVASVGVPSVSGQVPTRVPICIASQAARRSSDSTSTDAEKGAKLPRPRSRVHLGSCCWGTEHSSVLIRPILHFNGFQCGFRSLIFFFAYVFF